MVRDYKVKKTFIGGILDGLTVSDTVKNCSAVPFKVGQVVKRSACGGSYRIDAISAI